MIRNKKRPGEIWGVFLYWGEPKKNISFYEIERFVLFYRNASFCGLYKKIIKNVLKIVHDNCLPLRQSYTHTLKGIYRSQRFRNHPKNRKKALKADCKRAGIEPTIGHLKADHRLSRNFYKGVKGDAINVLLAAAAYNFKRAMRVLLYLIKRISIELVSTNFILKYSF